MRFALFALLLLACSSHEGTGNGDGGVADGTAGDGAETDDSGCATACPAGGSCDNGTCVCPATLVACGNACVDVESDPANCGGCGLACAGTCVTGGCKR